MIKSQNILRKIKYAGILLFVISQSCKAKENQLQKIDKVIIKTDGLVNEWLNFSYYNGINFKNEEIQIDASGIITLEINKLNTRFVRVDFKGMSKEVYLTTGDNLTMNIEASENSNNINFTGINEAHYNFFEEIRPFYKNSPKYLNNINDYQNLCKQFYDARKEFLENYCNINNCSIDFKQWVLNELLSDYYIHLLSPISSNEITLNDVPSDYFENIAIDSFTDLDLSSRKSTLAISYYIKNYFTKPSLKFSHQEINDQLDFIDNNLKGAIREFAITNVLHLNILNLLPSNIDMLKLKMKASKTQMFQEVYLGKITEIENKLNQAYTKLPDSILNVKLASLDNISYDINHLLNMNKGKVIVFDIWAHWCSWCIYDMEEAKDFKNRLIDQEKVEWFYLSIDKEKDRHKWIDKSQEKKELGLLKNQFLIDENDLPRFSEFADIDKGIPKYIIFDKKGNLILLDGPRPTDAEFFERAIDDLF